MTVGELLVLKEDAKRYRWLKERATAVYDKEHQFWQWTIPPVYMNGTLSLDNVIDQQMELKDT